MAAEYILAAGNPNVILCERGIRTFDQQYTRNTLDLAAIPVLRSLTHLPIMIDPSHGTGRAEYVPVIVKASSTAGADSVMVEVLNSFKLIKRAIRHTTLLIISLKYLERIPHDF